MCTPRRVSAGALSARKLTNTAELAHVLQAVLAPPGSAEHQSFQTICVGVRFLCKGCPWPSPLELNGVAFQITSRAVPSKFAA